MLYIDSHRQCDIPHRGDSGEWSALTGHTKCVEKLSIVNIVYCFMVLTLDS